MELEEMKAAFEDVKDTYAAWGKIQNKYSVFRDVHAFLVLERLLPREHAWKMIEDSGRSQVWLDVDVRKFAAIATLEIVEELAACGVFYDDGFERLSMFV